MKPKKCHFAKNGVRYLGYIVSESGISADKSKVEAVTSFPNPNSVKQLQSFLGLASYYRRFIPGFSKIAGPLFALIKKDALFEWSPRCNMLLRSLSDADDLKFSQFYEKVCS